IIVNKFGSMLNPFFSSQPISNFADAQKCDTKQFSLFFWELIKEGVFIPPSQFEAWFLSSALTEKDIEKTTKAINKAMEKVGKSS
ncbi:MAG: aspartate aminotransferase family protein, partial [Aureibaculum sp.]